MRKRTSPVSTWIAAMALLAIGFVDAHGQQLGTYNLQFLPQRSNQNPAFMPHSSFHAGIPLLSGIGYSWSNNGFTYNDLVGSGTGDSLVLKAGETIDGLDSRNKILFEFELDLLTAGFRMGKNYITLHATEKAYFNFNYSRALMEYLYHGNASTAGQVQQFNPGIEAVHYREYALTWGRMINRKFSVGTTLKYLYGMENAVSSGNGITLYTNPVDYTVTAQTDYTVQTSGLDSSAFNQFSASEYLFGKKNTGFAADLGIVYKPTQRFEITASTTDLGHITWKNGNSIYQTHSSDEPFVYSGINLDEFIGNDSTSAAQYLSDAGDSLYSNFNVTTTHESYRYRMPVKFFGSFSYLVTPRYRVGVLVRHRTHQTGHETDYQVSFTGKSRTWLNYFIAANKMNQTPVTLGAGISLNFHNNQFYFVSDNLPGMFSWKSAYNTGFRSGINIMFGTRPKYMKPSELPVAPQPVSENKDASHD